MASKLNSTHGVQLNFTNTTPLCKLCTLVQYCICLWCVKFVVAFWCSINHAFSSRRPLRVQHMDLSNCTVSVADLQSILCRCERLENLSLEGLVLSDDIIK